MLLVLSTAGNWSVPDTDGVNMSDGGGFPDVELEEIMFSDDVTTSWINTSSQGGANGSSSGILSSSAILDRLVPEDQGSRRDLTLDDPCSRFRFILHALVIGSICIVGLTGNTIAIFVLRRDRQNRVATFLLQSLAAADNLVLAVSFVILTVFFGWLPSMGGSAAVERSLPYLIKYINPLGCAVQSSAIWITVLLAANRFIAVCRPFTAHKHLTLNSARIQVSIVVAMSLLLNIPRIFKYDIETKLSNNGTTSTSAVVFSPLGRNVHFEMAYFTVLYTSMVLVLPLLLLVALNATLVRQLQASKRRMKRNSINYAGQSENDITVIMVAIVLELLVCHTPDRIIQVIHFIMYPTGRSPSCPGAMYYAENLSTLLIIISSASDFIIYYVFRRRFRVLVYNRLRSCFCCCFPASGNGEGSPGRLRCPRRSAQTEEMEVADVVYSNGRSRTPSDVVQKIMAA